MSLRPRIPFSCTQNDSEVTLSPCHFVWQLLKRCLFFFPNVVPRFDAKLVYAKQTCNIFKKVENK